MDTDARRPVRDALRARRQQREQPPPSAVEMGEGQVQVHTLEHGGRTRRYVVYLPKDHSADEPAPVVLNFHGGMGSAEIQMRQSQMNRVADEHGFIVVYPDGTGRTRLLTYNAGRCCGYAVRENVDDVGFVRELVTRALPTQYRIDRTRVYATGFSNGAMLAHRLGVELSQHITAIGAVGGTLGIEGRQPARPVPVIHFHGQQDRNSPFDGGVGENQFQPVPHRSVSETLSFWRRVNRAANEPVDQEEEQDFVRTRWEPPAGQAGAPVVLYALPQGGHTWPGGGEVGAHLNLGTLVESVDASAIMWQFFEQFQLEPDPAAGD